MLPRFVSRALFASVVVASTLAAQTPGRPALTSPTEFFGHAIGADYRLVTYDRFAAYWQLLARQSDRMVLDTIGRTAEGRPQLMAIISSPANLRKREQYRRIARQLAMGQPADSLEAAKLAREGKAIVWFDGGLHATEVVGSHQLIESTWQLLRRQDAETKRFLDDLIILAVHANPDGMQLVSSWYMKDADSTKRSTSTGDIPRLYQKYVGHDNNRDFYMITQPETRNMTRIQFREWLPQIVYNHHQQGPAGTVVFVPPFRDPHNHNIDPLVLTGVSLVGTAMHQRLIEEGKPGSVMRDGANYQTWWNGGLRTAPYFHNQIGLLTEINGNPTPMEIPFAPNRLVPTGDSPFPIEPQPFSFRTAIDYSVTMNWAVFDIASRHREQFLMNAWRMARHAITAGSGDHWTMYPRYVEAAKAAIGKDLRGGEEAVAAGGRERFLALLHKPEQRDARAYVIPRAQRDFVTATRFVNTLIRGGVTVHRATAPFAVGGTSYGAGSYIVYTAQPFRAHVLDMFEPQDYPNDFQYPGGPPKPPYDAAGYTLAYQMGVTFDRVLDRVEAAAESLADEVPMPAGSVEPARGAGWLLTREMNDAVVAINRLLKAKASVKELLAEGTADGRPVSAGTLFIPQGRGVESVLQGLAKDRGLTFRAVAAAPVAAMRDLTPIRIGLWDRYSGATTSGWTRWLLEQNEFDFALVYPQELDAGDLAAKFDVIVIPDGALPRSGRLAGESRTGIAGADRVPPEFRYMVGALNTEKTVPALKAFVAAGRTLVTIGNATGLAPALGIPVANHLVEPGTERPLPREKFYVPGSILRVGVDTTAMIARGMPAQADMMFDNSYAFRLPTDAATRGMRVVARFEADAPLRSGWAWGQQYLKGGAAVVEADLGKGVVVLFGPEVIFRAQPHGTFKLFFNSLYRTATAAAPTP